MRPARVQFSALAWAAFASAFAARAASGASVEQWSPPRIASDRDGHGDASWPPRCLRPR
jgi:hypothetical protein